MDEILLKAKMDLVLSLIEDEHYKPMKLKEICTVMGVPKSEKEDLHMVLSKLVEDGKVLVNQKGKYRAIGKDILKGTFSAHPRGFGFVTVEGMDEDIYINGDDVSGAMQGDTVACIITSKGKGNKRFEGRILRVLKRANETIVGMFQKSKNYGFVIPDNPKFNRDIFVQSGRDMGAMTGHKVVVRILDYGSETKKPEGKIIEILGHVNDPGTDILSIVKAFNIPMEFPEEVMTQVEGIPDEVQEAEKAGRKDIRDWQTVTIDGEEAKDLDDAITLTKKGDHYMLGVHIADVSHYVTERSPLDKEALKRGTSVYLVDRVIPMLPHKLSNGICSLNAGVDRLALSCIMEIDQKGNIVGHEIAETLIRVDERMTYTSVAKIIEDQDPEEMARYEALVPMFECMAQLSKILREKRRQRGGIDFEFPESKITLDEKGRAVDVKPYDRNSATKFIEDFMLAANETVAEDFFWQEVPFLYRTHETPDLERIQKLTNFIKTFGYYLKVKSDEIHPKEFQKLLGKIEGTPEEGLIARLTLRSMKQAKYTTENSGHFGLAVSYYCHFTSPIRRYPDLQIHRIIKEVLCGRYDIKRQVHYKKLLPEVAVATSTLERRADDAEREVDKLKKVEYMSRHIGEIYKGVISGTTNYGMYVELENTCEGMVRLADLMDDYYMFNEQNMSIVGEMTHRTFSMGDEVYIQVAGADKMTRNIDFYLVDAPEIE